MRLGTMILRRALALLFLILAVSFPSVPALATPEDPCNELLVGEPDPNRNPLLSSQKIIEWTAITPNHVLEAARHQARVFKKEFLKILTSAEPPTFENTILAIEFAYEDLNRTMSVQSILDLNRNTAELQRVLPELNRISSDLTQKIYTNRALFNRIKQISETVLPGSEESLILNEYVESFEEAGFHLSNEHQRELDRIEDKLTVLSNQFDQNILTRRNAIRVRIRDLSELDGVPERVLQAVRRTRDGNGDHWIPLRESSLVGVIMEKANSSELRQKLYHAFAQESVASRYLTPEEAGEAWKIDNRPLVIEIANLRIKKARILGHERYADRVLTNRMAKNVEQLRKFYADLAPRIEHAVEREKQELLAFARTLDRNIQEIPAWDEPYYASRLSEHKFRIDREKVREYFEVGHTTRKVFDFLENLFGLKIEKTALTSYLPEVEVYRVLDVSTGKHLAEIHLDLFSRSTKQPGAWKAGIQKAGVSRAGRDTAILQVSMNIDRAPEGLPTLLRVSDVKTLFHEMGHALHECLTTVRYKTFAGTAVYRDFVEFPSQIMENWVLTPEFLKTAAIHYQTRAPMPADWADRIRAASSFRAGRKIQNQMLLGLIDLEWHSIREEFTAAGPALVDDFERAIHEQSGIQFDEARVISPGFDHIFSGGYAAGYYGYLWANLLDADGFQFWYSDPEKIKERAMSLRKLILSRGGTADPNELYRKWRGQDPDPELFLKHNGL